MVENARPRRLFVAINLPDVVRRRLAAVQAELTAHAVPFRWARPEGTHATLAFLGSTDTGRVSAIARAVAGTAARHSCFELDVRGLGCFPAGDRARPRVLWAGLGGKLKALAELQRDLAYTLRQAGVALEDRAFRPHVTLGRARASLDEAQTARLRQSLEAAAGRSYGGWMVQTIDLMRSEPQRGGSLYTVLRAAPLRRIDVVPPRATALETLTLGGAPSHHGNGVSSSPAGDSTRDPPRR